MRRSIELFSVAFVAVFLLQPLPTAVASDYSDLYDKSLLEKEKLRLQARIKLIQRAFLENLTPQQQRQLQGMDLDFPLVGRNRHFLDFYADSRTSTVTMPILSLKFFEDLSTAYAWLWVNKYKFETVSDYISMLRYRSALKFPERRYPSPLSALGIPKNALEDSNVDDMALYFRNTGWAFILAHEMGHIYHKHSYQTMVQARHNERQADQFAIDAMCQTGTIPMGAIIYFTATAFSTPGEADFQSQEQWLDYFETKGTHPLNSARLRALAERVNEAALSLTKNESNRGAGIAKVRFIAELTRQMGEMMEDVHIQRASKVIGLRAPASWLKPRKTALPENGLKQLQEWLR